MSILEKKMKLLEGTLNLIRRKRKVPPDEVKIAAIKSIVVINNKRLGDFLFSTPAIRTLKEANPTAKIIAITSTSNAGLVSKNPFIDEVMFMGNSVREAVKIGNALRQHNPDLGIIFHSKSPYGHIALVVAGARCILKHYFGNEKSVLLSVCDGYVMGGIEPPVQNNMTLISLLGVDGHNKDMFFPSPIQQKKVDGLSIGVQLGASGENRFFPVATAAEMIEGINKEYPDCKFYLLGIAKEEWLGNELLISLGDKCKKMVVNHIGKTSIQQLAEIINNLSLVITPDTGALHVATALKTKTVSLFVKRQRNASIPQQNKGDHFVIYASDYPVLDEQDATSQLAPIPSGEIVKAILNMI